MNMNLSLYNIEEDIDNIKLYLDIICNADNLEKFIDGLYLNIGNEPVLIGELEYRNSMCIFNIDKNYLMEILRFNAPNSAFFEVRVNLIDSLEYFRIRNLSQEKLFWKWDECDFSIIYIEQGLKVLKGTEVELMKYENVYGKLEYINESENAISIKKMGIDSKIDKFLRPRIVKDSVNTKYSIRFMSRKTNTVIYELNNCKNTDEEFIFKVKSSEIAILKNFDYMYNIFFVVKNSDDEYSIRIRPDDSFNILPHVVCDDKECFYIRQYKTKDNYISLIIKDYNPCIDIEKIDFSEESIEINGSVKDNLGKNNTNVEDIYIKDKYDTKVTECIKFDINKINKTNYFKICIDNKSLFNKYVNDKFHIILLLNIHNKPYEYKLEFNSEKFNKEKSIFYPEVACKQNCYDTKLITSYDKNVLVLKIDNTIEVKIEEFKLKKDFLEIKCRHNLKEDNLKFKLAIIGKEQEYIIESAESIDNTIVFNIDQNFIRKINYYDVYDINVNISSNNRIFIRKVILDKDNIKLKNTHFNFKTLKDYGTIITINNKDGIIQLRKMNILNFRKVSLIKNKAAKLLAKYTKKFIKRPVWLVGENLAQIAQDNGFAFFDYCMKNNKKEKVFYVSQINNKNYDNLEKYKKNILRYDSFKHMYYYELSKYLIVSHGIRDVIPTIFHSEIGKNQKDIIYLQHGIIAMKKVFFNKSSYNSKIKKFIVTSEREKNTLITQMNFNEDQVAVTGLSRFDNLVDNSKNEKIKTILVMPTWREWILNNKADFVNSNFYKGYSKFLGNKRLHNLLEENNIILKFYPHIEIQKRYIDLFTYIHPNIEVVRLGEENVQDLIKNSLMMITDYSSVALDFNYLKKPVVFYQSDYEEYMKFRGSFINMETDLPGERCCDDNELVEIIEKYILIDFKYKDEYLLKSKQFYKYNDKKNNERIYNLIK